MRLDTYINNLTAVLQSIDLTAVITAIELINDARKQSRNVFVIGNGGSQATADHFVCDLFKNVPHSPPIHSLTNLPTLTAYANDNGYHSIYLEQMKRVANWGDLLVAISTSGNSPNVVKCAEYAKAHGLKVIGLTSRDGGSLRGLCTVELHADTDVIEMAEDVHLAMCHMIIKYLKDRSYVGYIAENENLETFEGDNG